MSKCILIFSSRSTGKACGNSRHVGSVWKSLSCVVHLVYPKATCLATCAMTILEQL